MSSETQPKPESPETIPKSNRNKGLFKTLGLFCMFNAVSFAFNHSQVSIGFREAYGNVAKDERIPEAIRADYKEAAKHNQDQDLPYFAVELTGIVVLGGVFARLAIRPDRTRIQANNTSNPPEEATPVQPPNL